MIDDITTIIKICGLVETLSDNDLDRLCLIIDGEILVRKEREKYA